MLRLFEATALHQNPGVRVQSSHLFRLLAKQVFLPLAEFDVGNVGLIRWSENAFARLVLPHGYKDIIRAFVSEQLSLGDGFDDIIAGKGRICSLRLSLVGDQVTDAVDTGLGFIMLLSGEPGVGKTLTAESGKLELFNPRKCCLLVPC